MEPEETQSQTTRTFRIAVKTPIRFILRKILGNYGCYKIFAYDLNLRHCAWPDLERPYRFAEIDEEDMRRPNEELIRKQAWYAGEDASGFGIYRGDFLVCIQLLWYGERYKGRDFWPLKNDEAKSVQLVTVPSERSKGLATKLKQFSANCMRERGFRRLYSRVWWNDWSSIRVNEKAGWRHIATVLQLYPLGRSRPWKLVKRKLAI